MTGDTAARPALEALCRAYWYPVYAFLRRRGIPPADAEDSTQSFFLHLLERDVLGRADPQRGRFRSFLLACLNHYVADERDKARAQRRGGGLLYSVGWNSKDDQGQTPRDKNGKPEWQDDRGDWVWQGVPKR